MPTSEQFGALRNNPVSTRSDIFPYNRVFSGEWGLEGVDGRGSWFEFGSTVNTSTPYVNLWSSSIYDKINGIPRVIDGFTFNYVYEGLAVRCVYR